MKFKEYLQEAEQLFLTEPKEIKAWLDKRNIWLGNNLGNNVSFGPNGEVSVVGSVNIPQGLHLDRLAVKFEEVTGNFNCVNAGLTTLLGTPQKIGGSFNCSSNMLRTLENGPTEVGENYIADTNNLVSLKGAPRHIKEKFSCSYNPNLTTLTHAPSTVDGTFYADNCNLTSLKGAPAHVKRVFSCSYNKLETLKGLPDTIQCMFRCKNNPLNSFDSFPSNIDQSADLRNTKITSLIGIESKIKRLNGLLYISGNNITSGGLGLLFIEDFRGVICDKDDANQLAAFAIIQKYIGKPDKIFECQEELIEAGFEEYAQL